MKKLLRSLCLIGLYSLFWYKGYTQDLPVPRQAEEGFRWRRACRLVLSGQDITANAQGKSSQIEHLEMNDIETFLSHSLPYYSYARASQDRPEINPRQPYINRDAFNRNIALAKISVVLQVGERLVRVSDWVKWIDREGQITPNIAVFISGQEGTLTNTSLTIIHSPQADPVTYPVHEANGTTTKAVGQLSRTLVELFNSPNSCLDRYIKDQILKDATAEVETGKRSREGTKLTSEDRARQFPEHFHHSEQWLMYYLGQLKEDRNVISILVDQIISQAASQGTKGSPSAIMLHIHSKNDLCNRCTASVYQFNSSSLVVKFKKEMVEKYSIEQEPIFLTIASSRVNNYPERRAVCGHDDHFNATIDVRTFSPWFVQIAMPDIPFRQSVLRSLGLPPLSLRAIQEAAVIPKPKVRPKPVPKPRAKQQARRITAVSASSSDEATSSS